MSDRSNDFSVEINDQHRLFEAEEVRREILAVRERVQSKEHPPILMSRNDLALVPRY